MKLLSLCLSILLNAVALNSVVATESQPSKDLFDPSRHMRVSEVKPGMKGYGLSVFKDTTIERFEVEVLSILQNFNPKSDVILIQCSGANLEHTGAVAGMSGSPIYLRDENGKEKMIGALAYGWPLSKDPVAGVQPIEYMLKVPSTLKKDPATRKPARAGDRENSSRKILWSIKDAAPWLGTKKAFPPINGSEKLMAGNSTRLQPLATPLMVGGLPPEMLKQFAPVLEQHGLTALQAGGSGGSNAANENAPKMEPGSVLAIPLLKGDLEMTAIGTCTEVIGDRVFGFGHPFQNEGDISLPMGGGRINSVIANMMSSFKLGSLSGTPGTFTADHNVGIAGMLGESPPFVPMNFRVVYEDGSQDQMYHFDSALHPRYTSILVGMAFATALTGASQLPVYNTLDYDVSLNFDNGKTVRLSNRIVNAGAFDLFSEIGMPITIAAENPFERIMVKDVEGTVRVRSGADEAQILNINLPRSKYRPGETVKAFVTHKPFRKAEAILPVQLELPRDLPNGAYQLTICDSRRFLNDEMQMKPFQFTAEEVDEIFDVLHEISAIRNDALYLRLVRQPDGVAIGRTAMPQLPSSRRQVLMGAGRSNTSMFVSSTVKKVPTELVMNGSAEFAITIDSNAKVERGGEISGDKTEKNADKSKDAGTDQTIGRKQKSPAEE